MSGERGAGLRVEERRSPDNWAEPMPASVDGGTAGGAEHATRPPSFKFWRESWLAAMVVILLALAAGLATGAVVARQTLQASEGDL
jgi:hypothetical protein